MPEFHAKSWVLDDFQCAAMFSENFRTGSRSTQPGGPNFKTIPDMDQLHDSIVGCTFQARRMAGWFSGKAAPGVRQASLLEVQRPLDRANGLAMFRSCAPENLPGRPIPCRPNADQFMSCGMIHFSFQRRLCATLPGQSPGSNRRVLAIFAVSRPDCERAPFVRPKRSIIYTWRIPKNAIEISFPAFQR